MSGPAGIADRFLADHAALASPPFGFTHFTLFESHLASEGAIYETVERYPLT
jgi:2'-5' RNA ligase